MCEVVCEEVLGGNDMSHKFSSVPKVEIINEQQFLKSGFFSRSAEEEILNEWENFNFKILLSRYVNGKVSFSSVKVFVVRLIQSGKPL